MFRGFAVAVLVLAASFTPAGAQEACPCIPTSQVWISSACDTWNCALSAMVTANGSAYVVAMPSNATGHPWVILKRVNSGSAIVVPPDAFVVDSYTTMSEAAVQYQITDPATLPQMMTTVDGKSLVIRLREADPQFKRRAVRR